MPYGKKLLVFAALLLIAVPALAASPTASVADIKAAYLVKFGPFFEWQSPPAAPARFPICAVGESEVSRALDHAAAGQKVGDAAIEVRHLGLDQSVAGCRIAYFADGARLTEYPSVLTVTEASADPAGIISFVIENNHVRFDIDLDAATKAGLRASAKLLGLAHAVKGKP